MIREPLVVRGAVVGALTALLHALVVFGVVPGGEKEAALVAVLDLVATAVLVVWSRGAVTPVADPKDADGAPLVPAVDVPGYESL